jgi:hypothetical protein
LIESRIVQTQRWLDIPAGLLLTKNVGDVIGAESAGRMSFSKRGSDSIRAVFANQGEQLAHLTSQGSVRGGEATEIFFRGWSQQGHHAMLSGGSFRSGPQSKQLFLKALGAEGLATPPRARVANP